MRIVWQTVRRITYEILGGKGSNIEEGRKGYVIIESFCARGILRVKSHNYFFFFTPENKFLFILVTRIFFPSFFKDVNE